MRQGATAAAAAAPKDLEAVRVAVKEPEDGQVELGAQALEELPRGDVGLPLARDDDARVLVVEAVLGEAHKGGVLLHQQDKGRVALQVGDFVHERGDGLAADAHARAVDVVAVLVKGHPADDDALLRGDHVEARARAPDHGRHVVEHRVTLLLLAEQLHVRVEEVALGDVDAALDDLVHQLEHARGDGRLAHAADVGKRPRLGRVAQHDAVELGHVQLVAARARGDLKLRPPPSHQHRTRQSPRGHAHAARNGGKRGK